MDFTTNPGWCGWCWIYEIDGNSALTEVRVKFKLSLAKWEKFLILIKTIETISFFNETMKNF